MAAPWMAAFEMVASEMVVTLLFLGKSNKIVILLTLVMSIFYLKNSLRRNWVPELLSGQLIHVTGTPPGLLRPFKVSTSSELYPDYFRLPTFLNDQASSFFILLT